MRPTSVAISIRCVNLVPIGLGLQHGSRGQNECHLCMSVLGNISTAFLALLVGGNISTISVAKHIMLINSPTNWNLSASCYAHDIQISYYSHIRYKPPYFFINSSGDISASAFSLISSILQSHHLTRSRVSIISFEKR